MFRNCSWKISTCIANPIVSMKYLPHILHIIADGKFWLLVWFCANDFCFSFVIPFDILGISKWHLFICIFNMPLLKNAIEQFSAGQCAGLGISWFFKWNERLLCCENEWFQYSIGHLYGTSFVWTRICVLRLYFRENHNYQYGHGKGFSPVCTNLCRTSLLLFSYIFPQNSHYKSFIASLILVGNS